MNEILYSSVALESLRCVSRKTTNGRPLARQTFKSPRFVSPLGTKLGDDPQLTRRFRALVLAEGNGFNLTYRTNDASRVRKTAATPHTHTHARTHFYLYNAAIRSRRTYRHTRLTSRICVRYIRYIPFSLVSPQAQRIKAGNRDPIVCPPRETESKSRTCPGLRDRRHRRPWKRERIVWFDERDSVETAKSNSRLPFHSRDTDCVGKSGVSRARARARVSDVCHASTSPGRSSATTRGVSDEVSRRERRRRDAATRRRSRAAFRTSALPHRLRAQREHVPGRPVLRSDQGIMQQLSTAGVRRARAHK